MSVRIEYVKMVRGNGAKIREKGEMKDIPSRVAWMIFIAIAAYSLIVLSPSLKGYFLRDDFFSFEAPALNSLSDIPEVFKNATRWGSRFLHLGIYFSVGRGLWGFNPFAWHLSNLVIFALDLVFLFGIYLRLLRNRTAALIAIGIFALTGASFYTQAWVTGSVEILAGLFAFSALLAHLWAIQDETTKTKRILRESLAILLLSCAFVTKETTVPVVLVWVLVDYYLKKRITAGGIAAIIVGIGGLIIGILRPLALLRLIDSYDLTLSPMHLLMNFVAYYFDPILATGAEFWLLERIGSQSGASEVIWNLPALLSENLIPAVIVCLVIAGVGISWFVYTIRASGTARTKAVLPGWVGWVMWFIFLIPAIVTTGHHIPYYVFLPMAFLMLAVGPVLAGSLRSRKTAWVVIAGLFIYAAWFPINTALAIEYSNLTVGSREIVQLFGLIEEISEEEVDGFQVVLDGVDAVHEDRIAYIYSIEWKFEDVEAFYTTDFRRYLRTRTEAVPEPYDEFRRDGDVRVLMKEEGEWRDVTDEYPVFGEAPLEWVSASRMTGRE